MHQDYNEEAHQSRSQDGEEKDFEAVAEVDGALAYVVVHSSNVTGSGSIESKR